MCEYEYSKRVAACNETRIYPSGCCPNDDCECHNHGCHKYDCLKYDRCKHDKCCEPETVTGADGVNRINFCPPCSDKCE